jgi:hypothetical protein
MLKIELKQEVEQAQKYPYIGSSNRGRIVLFSSKGHGVLLKDPNGSRSAGDVSDSWNESCFEPFKGQVILENSKE